MKRTLVIMVLVWLTAMAVLLFSPTIRTPYWGWRLGRAATKEQREYYALRLAAYPDAAVRIVERLMKHPDPDIRLRAIRSIEGASAEAAVDVLLRALSDPDIQVRDGAALVLGRRAGPPVLRQLARLAAGPDADVAASAVFSLQRNAGPIAIESLLQVLRTASSVDVCVQAIESLGLLGIEEAGPLLQAKLSDHRRTTRVPANERAVRRALAAHRDHRGLVGITTEATSDTEAKTVAQYAAEALRRIRREHGVPSQSAPRQATRRSDP